MSRNELLNQKATLIKELRALSDSTATGITEELQSQYDAKKAQVESINSRLKMDDDLRALEREAQGIIISEGSGIDPSSFDAQETPKLFSSFGEQMHSIVSAGRGGALDPRLLELNKYSASASGQNTTVDSEGGFLVQTDFSQDIMRRSYETGQLVSRCRSVEISAASNKTVIPYLDEDSRANGSRLGGIRVYRTAEAGTAESSKTKLGRLEIGLEKLQAIAYLTDEMIEDGAVMGSFLQSLVAEEFAFMEDSEIYEGTGVGQCLGVKKSKAAITVDPENGQDVPFLFENAVGMWSRMYSRSRFNSIWVYNQELEPDLMKMYMPVGTGGVPVFMPPGALSTSPYASLFGRPMIPIEHCDAPGTFGDIGLLDLSEYLYARKGGMKTDVSMHVRFLQGEQALRFTKRTNGQPAWKKALTPLKGTKTVSPFVFLGAR